MSATLELAALETPVMAELVPDEVSVVVGSEVDATSSQTTLIAWISQLIRKTEVELKERTENFEIAKKNHWNLVRIKQDLHRLSQKAETYHKLRAAFEAGYILVPDFTIDIFAVRTTRKKPTKNFRSGENRWNGPTVRAQESEAPALGEGRYVSEEAITAEKTYTIDKKAADGTVSPVMLVNRWAEKFREEITFPFALSKPHILTATERAMALKIFDEIGVSPARTFRKKDPVVVGRIKYLSRNFDFLIAWFIPVSTLKLR